MRKKSLRNIVAGALILGLFTSPSKKHEQFKEISKSKLQDYLYILADIKPLQDYYTHEKVDYWQTPEETIKLKTGDCEDKSIYFYDVLKKEGYNPFLAIGKEDSTDRRYHVWVGIDSRERSYYVECSRNGEIFDVKDLEKGKYCLEYDKEYLKHWKSKKKEVEKRGNIKLTFKNFEPRNQ